MRRALAHARAALVERRARLGESVRDALALGAGEAEVVVAVPPPPAPQSPAWLAARLKRIERALLDDALARLDGWVLF